MTKSLAKTFLELQDIFGSLELRRQCEQYLKVKRFSIKKMKRKPIPWSWIVEAYKKQYGLCPRCGKVIVLIRREVEGDHLVALSQGGEHSRRNIRCLHRHCNREKGSASLIQESKRGHGTILEQLQ